ncbi:MAG: hypothetical protein IH841_09175 [Thaumarchaeota archaeon]|nr:hypothetical protein [Nitrososphaerota archaeon]
MAKKKTLCADASNMSDIEKKIMATSMKAGQDQINILREEQAKNKKSNLDLDAEEIAESGLASPMENDK